MIKSAHSVVIIDDTQIYTSLRITGTGRLMPVSGVFWTAAEMDGKDILVHYLTIGEDK